MGHLIPWSPIEKRSVLGNRSSWRDLRAALPVAADRLLASPLLVSGRQPNEYSRVELKRQKGTCSQECAAVIPSRQVEIIADGSVDDESEERPLRAASQIDQDRIRRAVREILFAVGEDPDREGLRDTPARVARMYAEVFSGLHDDPREHLKKFFTEKYDEIVLVRDISFNSTCEHHLLPFMGQAHIGYVPNGRVVGLSKLARVVEVVARRPQVQERMTEAIADLLEQELDVKGVAVVIEATHTCMTVRGIRKPGSLCVTSAMRGIFRSNLSSRSEVMTLIYGGRP